MFENQTGFYFPINGEKEAWHSMEDIPLSTKLQLKATTMCFVTMYLGEAWIALESRSEKTKFYKLKANWALFILLTLSILILILVTNWGFAMAYLGLIQLSVGDAIICLILSLTPIFVMELYKTL
jgi:magnesium-transporting ATPase (P-type)